MNAFPLVSFDLIADAEADALLVEWEHFLGGCNRPFGRQSWGLVLGGVGVISVAVSASTVNKTCGGLQRSECVELARLCSHPDHAWATRIGLRLWREVAVRSWPYWPVHAAVSYSDNTRHTGDVYRFDGWKRGGSVRGETGGGTWSRKKTAQPKTVWFYDFGRIVNGLALVA